MEKKRFLDVNDVAEYLGVSVSKAYKIIHSMNNDLSKNGFITVAGKISRVYFEEKVYGVA